MIALPPLPSKWLSEYFYIPEPRDPVTGEFFGAGPIRLGEVQARIIDEAFSRDHRRLYKYSTVIYSTIKKSGKSTLSAGCGLYMMEHTPFGRGYCLANDGEQSKDRLLLPIKTCMDLHNELGGIYKGIYPTKTSVRLKNKAEIGSLPCDTAGNAGSEPTISLFSELWGFTTDAKRKLFSEMTVPSTRFGRAIRWIETYAGYQGESDLLWSLYEQAVLQGHPHPDFLDLTSGGKPVVWVNEAAGIFCYWDHEGRMAWQLGEEGDRYYQQESRVLDPGEFRRIHKNEWISPTGSFLEDAAMWDNCADRNLAPLEDKRTPMVVALDAAESNDCAAIVGVTRHPLRPDTDIAVRACKIFKPGGPTGTILLEPTLGRTLLQWSLKYNILVVAYDKYQLTKMVQDYRKGSLLFSNEELMQMMLDFGQNPKGVEAAIDQYKRAVQLWYYMYSQQTERTVSDKFLYDLIVHRRLAWNPEELNYDIGPRGDEETLTKHIKQAGTDESKGRRLVKLSNTMKIDAAVALSMAAELCLRLNISAPNDSPEIVTKQFREGGMSYEEYMRRIAEQMRGNNGRT